MIKNLFRVTLIGAFLIGSITTNAQTGKVLDKVVAKVGGELILFSDIEEQFSQVSQQQGGQLPDAARCEILQNQIITKLMLNQSRLDSIIVGPEEVEAQLDARFERILAYMQNDESQFVAYYGQSIAETKEQFREDLEDQILVERMQSSVVAAASVTPKEVKEFFNSIPQDSLPYFNSEVEVSEIVYPPKVNEEQKEIARKKLEGIRDEILAGGSFEELAKKHSDDPGSGRAGGDLGWQRRGTFVTEFEAAAYNLEIGEYSEIIETMFGFHFMRLEGRRGNSVNVRHILIKPEITNEDLDRAKTVLDSISNLLNIDSLSFSRAVKKYSNEDEQSYSNDGFMLNPSTGNTFFEIKDLDPDIYFTLDTMDINQVSGPIEYRTPAGEISYRIIKLISRTNPHTANLTQDYSKIREACLEQKKGKFINDWVLDKLKETYIDIDPSYMVCPNLQDLTNGNF